MVGIKYMQVDELVARLLGLKFSRYTMSEEAGRGSTRGQYLVRIFEVDVPSSTDERDPRINHLNCRLVRDSWANNDVCLHTHQGILKTPG